MIDLKKFQENKAVLTVKGGMATGKTHRATHKATQINGNCDTRIIEYGDNEKGGREMPTEECVQYDC